MYLLSDYDYTLPENLIAQNPAPCRDQSRLMVLARGDQSIAHHRFSDLVGFLHSGDLLVVNDTRVVPARLAGTKETGGKVEVLLLDYPGERVTAAPGSSLPAAQKGGRSETAAGTICECLIKASKAPRAGSIIHFGEGLTARVLRGERGLFDLDFQCREHLDRIMETAGEVPLPPYVKRNGQTPPPCDDRQSYQTVYAKEKGAVAAPTAGLHFSSELLERIAQMGVEIVSLTLHVGYGTFLPVRVEDIRDHQIHSEAYALSARTASAINRAKEAGRRVIAVGTTSVRVLEYAADETCRVRPGLGKCDLWYVETKHKKGNVVITVA
ncbi:MAG: tRNA preQ1(34) S-adenosylmethionine ribosyltransferase-isomerase QueA, partial [Thermodesulfobacteriota bacterium]|nr:tRNA preQ1(34) S-adenosylmethionine ribosyltransferase-isomerase QueA [Thermodesulfobacteriota bacterium]